eukprot:gene2741-960_t
MEIDKFLVTQVSPKVFYIPDFVSEAEEKLLLEKVYDAPKPKWTQLSGRRLQNWGGLPHPKGMVQEAMPQWLTKYTDRVASYDFFDGRLPNHVLVNEYTAGQGIMPHVDGPLFHPAITTISLGSQTLLDFYRPITDTICGESDRICGNQLTMSLFFEPFGDIVQLYWCCYETESGFESRYIMSILLHPRSLVIFKDDMYKVYLHGIKESTTDTITTSVINPDPRKQLGIGETLQRGTRVSLTIRNVPKVLRLKLGLQK